MLLLKMSSFLISQIRNLLLYLNFVSLHINGQKSDPKQMFHVLCLRNGKLNTFDF